MTDRASAADIYCRKCDYCLRSLPAGKCPECGHPFNPDDPRTWLPPRKQRGSIWQLIVTMILAAGIIFWSEFGLPPPMSHGRFYWSLYDLPEIVLLIVMVAMMVGVALSGVRRCRGIAQSLCLLGLIASLSFCIWIGWCGVQMLRHRWPMIMEMWLH